MINIHNNQSNVNIEQKLIKRKRELRILDPDLVERNTPPELKALPFVVVNRWKVPIFGSVYDPRNQFGFERALEHWRKTAVHPDSDNRIYGVGAVLTAESGIVCLDLDDKLDPRNPLVGADLQERQEIEQWMWKHNRLHEQTYSEVSGGKVGEGSVAGVHHFVYGRVYGGTRKNRRLNIDICGHQMIVLTGDCRGSVGRLVEGQRIIDWLCSFRGLDSIEATCVGALMVPVDYGTDDVLIERARVRDRLNRVWRSQADGDWSLIFFGIVIDLIEVGAGWEVIGRVVERSSFVRNSEPSAMGEERDVKARSLLKSSAWCNKVVAKANAVAHGRAMHEALQRNGSIGRAE